MDIKLYHGSRTQGIVELKPNQSTQEGAYVYATPSEVLATIFINRQGALLLQISEKDSKFIICERKPGIIKQTSGIPGSVYEVDPTNFDYFTEHSWKNFEVRAKGTQKVLKEDRIPNLYERFQQYENQGLLDIYYYPKKLDYMAEDDSDLVQMAFQLYFIGNKCTDNLDHFKKHYPQFRGLTDRIYNKVKNYSNKDLESFVKNMYDKKEKKLNFDLIGE